jgi:hypothetical protein
MAVSRHKVYEQVSKDEENEYIKEVVVQVSKMPKPRGWTRRKSRGRPKKRGAGRPPEFEWWSLVVVLLLMQYLGLGYRLTAAHISARPDLMKTLELDKPPSKSTLHRAQQSLSQGWLEELNRRVLFQFKKGVARRGST